MKHIPEVNVACPWRNRRSGARPLARAAVVFLLILPVLLPASGCRPHQIPACRLLPGRPVRSGPLVVGMIGPVDLDRAPACQNDSERLLSHHLYETLVRVDCRGETCAALAESWSISNGGKTCTFTIRQGSRFSDGSPVDATDVQSAWALNERQDRATGCPSPWTWLYPLRTQVLDDHQIRITAPQAIDNFPVLFAHPSFRIGVVQPGAEWPLGTGPYRIVSRKAGPDRDVICEANEYYEGDVRIPDRLVFRIREGRDPRDLSAFGADLFVVRELEALDYVHDVGYETAPLRWDRNYLLLVPPTSETRSDPWIVSDWDRGDLARNVVEADARESFRIGFPVEPGVESGSSDRGHLPPARSGVPVGHGSLVHPEDDPDARFLAEKIAADLRHGRLGSAANVYPVSLAPQALAESVRRGSDFAYVFPLARSYNDSRFLVLELTACAPWLMRALEQVAGSLSRSDAPDPDGVADRLVRTGLVTPLVLTRPHLVYRNGLAGGKVDGLGHPELQQVGWLEGSDVP